MKLSEEEKLIATLATQIHLEKTKNIYVWGVEDSVEKAKQIIEASRLPNQKVVSRKPTYQF